MQKRRSLSVILLALMSQVPLHAQGNIEMDPEGMKIMENFQKQNENIPRELLALMPAGLEITRKNWMVEPSEKMQLTLSLESMMNSVRLENTVSYQLNLRISMTAYNMKSEGGRMLAGQMLEMLRGGARDSWPAAHPESERNHTKVYPPEKIVLPKGFILIQKSYSPRHGDGEGMVSERTTYAGFLYQEVEAGFLTAEFQAVPNTKTGIEKWLRQIASSAAKLKPGDCF
jgi:hypothetical protein